MALNPREAFKTGFLLRCAEAGLRPAPVVKRAFESVTALASPVASLGSNALVAAALGVPVAAGGLAGYMAHTATEKPINEDDVKDTEVADEYRRLSRVAKLNAKLRHLRSRAGQM